MGDITTDNLINFGIGIVAIYIVLRLVFNFLTPWVERKLGTGDNGNIKALRAEIEAAKVEMRIAKRQIEELHQWHNARTDDGGFRWYVPSSLEKAIESLAQSIDKQSDVLANMVSIQRDTCNYMERMERKLESMEKRA